MSNSTIINELLDVYLDYIREQGGVLRDIPFYDRFYLEQRIGCWVSGIEHAWNLYDTVRLQPLDCQNIVNIMLEICKRDTQAGMFQLELIKRNEPLLLKYDFNAISLSLYERVVYRIDRIGNATRKFAMKYLWLFVTLIQSVQMLEENLF